MGWDDVLAAVARLGRNAFVATNGRDRRPHLAIVWVVVVDGVLHVVGDAASVKMRNVAADPAVALHWQVAEEGDTEGLQLFVRGEGRLVAEPAERERLWSSGAWGDLGQWYAGPDDPAMAFLRIDAASASLTSGYGGGERRRFRA
jgi:general stress protein 26